MKKIFSIVLVLVFVLTMSIGAFAAPAPKTAPVSLTASALTVKVGETVSLEAVTLKQGSDFTDSWTGATKGITVLNTATGYYVSKASFSAAVPGTYTIKYDIIMTAGKSNVSFVGTANVTITVINPATIVGAAIKNVKAKANINPNGKITGYDATGDVYAVWSDGRETFYGVKEFSFSANQDIRNIEVTINGTEYTIKGVNFPV